MRNLFLLTLLCVCLLPMANAQTNGWTPEQGYQLHRALQRLGVKTQMVTYPRQPHGFIEPKFIQNVGERVIDWFNSNLGRKAPPLYRDLPATALSAGK